MTTATLAPYPASVPELFAASGETVRDLAGADRSAWNGHIIESAGVMLGLAHWDGTLYLDREAIVDPLRHLYDHAGEPRPDQTLVAYRESLSTLLHEHAHFLGPEDASQEAAREAFTKPGSRPLEEGVTEAWAHDHLDEFIRRLGIDKVAPGINTVRTDGYYAAFVPAIRELTTHLDTHNGFPPGHTLTLLNRQTAAGQFPLLTDLTCTAHCAEPTPESKAHLESTLRTSLASLEPFELIPPQQATQNSLSTAAQLLTSLHQTTNHPLPGQIDRGQAVRGGPHPGHADACTLPPPQDVTPTAAPSPHDTAFAGLPAPTHASRPTTPPHGGPARRPPNAPQARKSFTRRE
ncbi:hypothetical protein [Kribbella sp. NPDC048915]|uniref:hypothetical protein n=1 Tax=Kribbella sp. NPDC048915 TaxID=3155148 RepID=UPI0033FE9191